MTKRERVSEAIDDMDERTLIGVWNEYCNNNQYWEDRFESMDEFDDAHSCMKPLEIANLVYDEDFDPNDEYYREGYRLESFYLPSNCINEMEIDSLIDYIVDNDDWLYNQDLRIALSGDDEEEEEEDEI